MKKTYGVCFGMLAMGLAVLGAPASRAQSRMAAGEAASASETSTTSEPATPAAASPSDLDRRIEALETELLELKTELETKKEADAAPAAAPEVVATPAAQDAAKPADKVTVASLFGPTSVSGFIDAYYLWNSDHPVTFGLGSGATIQAPARVGACSFDCRGENDFFEHDRIQKSWTKPPTLQHCRVKQDASAITCCSVGFGEHASCHQQCRVCIFGGGESVFTLLFDGGNSRQVRTRFRASTLRKHICLTWFRSERVCKLTLENSSLRWEAEVIESKGQLELLSRLCFSTMRFL